MSEMIKILFLAANPSATDTLRLDEEIRFIDTALQRAKFRQQFDLRSHWAVRIGDLHELFLRYKADIVHFSGHGSNASEIILPDDQGAAVVVPAAALSNLFAIFNRQIHCVLLNACFSAEQAAGIGEHIDAVIGMSDTISDQVAIQFSMAFYLAIGYGQDVPTAFRLGCNYLELSGASESHKFKLVGKSISARDSKPGEAVDSPTGKPVNTWQPLLQAAGEATKAPRDPDPLQDTTALLVKLKSILGGQVNISQNLDIKGNQNIVTGQGDVTIKY